MKKAKFGHHLDPLAPNFGGSSVASPIKILGRNAPIPEDIFSSIKHKIDHFNHFRLKTPLNILNYVLCNIK